MQATLEDEIHLFTQRWDQGALTVLAVLMREFPDIQWNQASVQLKRGGFLNELHYTAEDSNRKKYHLKTPALDNSVLGGSRLNELYIYKILELLGYGPKTRFIITQDLPGLIFILREDLTVDSKRFLTADELLGRIYCDDISYLKHTSSIDIITDLLTLDDVSDNYRNFGIRVDIGKFKSFKDDVNLAKELVSMLDYPQKDTDLLKTKVKPFIIDFQIAQKTHNYAFSYQRYLERTSIEYSDILLPRLATVSEPKSYYSGLKRLRDGIQSKGHNHPNLNEIFRNVYTEINLIWENLLRLCNNDVDFLFRIGINKKELWNLHIKYLVRWTLLKNTSQYEPKV